MTGQQRCVTAAGWDEIAQLANLRELDVGILDIPIIYFCIRREYGLLNSSFCLYSIGYYLLNGSIFDLHIGYF